MAGEKAAALADDLTAQLMIGADRAADDRGARRAHTPMGWVFNSTGPMISFA